MTQELTEKYKMLEAYFKKLGSVAIAFSSGVDSTFLLKVAHNVLGNKVVAITARSNFFPKRETEESMNFCKAERIKQVFIDIDELEIPGIKENPKNRCYICKSLLFKRILQVAEEENLSYVCEGSNMDDNGDYRPGLQAVKELGIKSPLRDCGFWKSEIREISKELGLGTWEKPSFACLASRFVYGETITNEKLKMIESAEDFLIKLGFTQERVRIHCSVNNDKNETSDVIARIEVLPQDFYRIIDNHEKICVEFKKIGFSYVSLDLQGYRTGSMNETIIKKQEISSI